MPLRIVQSKQNPRLKELRKALTLPARASESGTLIGLEGPNLIHEALRAGLTLNTLFFAEEKLLTPLTRSFPELLSVESLLIPRDLLNSTLTTESPQPIAALVEAPVWSWDSIAGVGPILILAGLQDPGNLGTILRSAEAFSAAAIISLPGTVSPWNPKALRASAGSAFRIPFLAATPKGAFAHLRKVGRHIFTTAVEGAPSASDANLAAPFALIIGNEGNGVSQDIAAQADSSITIPTGSVESLNAAIAASILLYEASRQRNAQSAPVKSTSNKRARP